MSPPAHDDADVPRNLSLAPVDARHARDYSRHFDLLSRPITATTYSMPAADAPPIDYYSERSYMESLYTRPPCRKRMLRRRGKRSASSFNTRRIEYAEKSGAAY